MAEKPPTRQPDWKRNRARELRAGGATWTAIADELQVGATTVRRWAADVKPPPPELEPDDGEQRQQDRRPQPPPGTPRVPTPEPDGGGQPVSLDFSAIHGYIEGAYRLGGKIASEQGNALLGEVIGEHAGAAATAWERWIRSEPRVQELLLRLMVGTPIGEVIGVHVSIVFAYTLARAAARQFAPDDGGDAAAGNGGGAPAGHEPAGTRLG